MAKSINSSEYVNIEYYTKDEEGELLLEYGEVCTDEIEVREGYEHPILKSAF